MRFLGKCGACKATVARDYAETERVWTGAGMFRRQATIHGRTLAGGRFLRAALDHECARCGAMAWSGRRVEGTTTATPCDARCTDATGHRCDCSCGGANHGRGWLICAAA